MENPIVRVCRERGLSRNDIAIVSKCNRSQIAHVERGAMSTLSGKVLDGLVALGYDRDEMARDYAKWRAAQSERIQAKMATA